MRITFSTAGSEAMSSIFSFFCVADQVDLGQFLLLPLDHMGLQLDVLQFFQKLERRPVIVRILIRVGMKDGEHWKLRTRREGLSMRKGDVFLNILSFLRSDVKRFHSVISRRQ